MLKLFELGYLLGEPILPYNKVLIRKSIKSILEEYPRPRKLLDVGARKSHYTIGLDAEILLLDIPRESEIQKLQKLGVTETVLEQLYLRRSNISGYIVENFLLNKFRDDTFDVVTAIEVIEHVEEDDVFMTQAFRILKPGGMLYLTTPNGNAVPNTNPDHVRHYTIESLTTLLKRFSQEVNVEEREVMTRSWKRGLDFWSPRKPVKMIGGFVANIVNRIENGLLTLNSDNTARLYATVRKR